MFGYGFILTTSNATSIMKVMQIKHFIICIKGKKFFYCWQANSEEITEVLNSSVQLLEPVSSCVKNFLPKVRNHINLKHFTPFQEFGSS